MVVPPTRAAGEIAKQLAIPSAVAGRVQPLNYRANKGGARSLPGVSQFGLEQGQPNPLKRAPAGMLREPIGNGNLLQLAPVALARSLPNRPREAQFIDQAKRWEPKEPQAFDSENNCPSTKKPARVGTHRIWSSRPNSRKARRKCASDKSLT